MAERAKSETDLRACPPPDDGGLNGQEPLTLPAFSYRDGEDRLRYQVIYDPGRKAGHYLRRPRAGSWSEDLKDVQRLPYRLPELLAKEGDIFVFIVESELEADRLWEHGYAATTCAGGLEAWTGQLSRMLGRRPVAILSRNDRVCEHHIEAVARSIRSLVAETVVIRLPGLPPDGGVVEWFEAGGTVAELDRLLAEAPSYEPLESGSALRLVSITEDEELPPLLSTWPEQVDKAALYGLAGEIVGMLDPTTEADPISVLITLLVAIGNIVGSAPHRLISGAEHPGRLFAMLVGPTSGGRKGTSWNTLLPLLRLVAPEWLKVRVASGLSSGEGLIHAVRDQVVSPAKVREKEQFVGRQEIVTDPGVDDKRLFVIEEEFAQTLIVMRRQGNTLSPVIRNAWANGNLKVLSKHSPAAATGAHISIVGHITEEELMRHFGTISASNGFANRFLWMSVRRSKSLPLGGQPDPERLAELAWKLKQVIEFAGGIGPVALSQKASSRWEAVYPDLTSEVYGLTGSVIARRAPIVVRLAILYALLDCSETIELPHLEAALAIWNYSERSVRHIFGNDLGDPIADKILDRLRLNGSLSRSELHRIGSRHATSGRLDQALLKLQAAGLVRSEVEATGGRPRQLWCAT